tara:strand:+ start:869 stop:1507 length:639 start_codon:yes stop_codon:yes gene_type:complete
MIGVYNDVGFFQPSVWEDGFVKIKKLLTDVQHKTITRTDINNKAFSLQEFSCIIFPGGYAYPGYTKYVSQIGKQRLRKFVEDGGKYVGICAGAYFAGRNVIYQDKDVTKTGNYDLNLFSGIVSGPAYKSNPDLRWKSTKILFEDDEIRMKYAAAPCFSEHGTIIARYLDNTPAIVSEKCGKGEVLLFGPHPELNSDQKTKTFFINLLTRKGN